MQRLFVLALLLALVPAAACSTRDSGSCTAGKVSCPSATGGTVCVTTASDVQNCGGCGIACATGEGCFTGHCGSGHDMGPVADLGPHDSGPRTDSGIVSMCMPTCSASQICCGIQCVPRTWAGSATTDGRGDSSFLNCGSCGHGCDPNTASRCAMGTAGAACECGANNACSAGANCVSGASGFTCQTDCGGHGACASGTSCCGSGATAACVDTHGTDDANCGTCGHACGAGQACTAGTCVDLCGGVPCRVASGTDPGELCCADTCVPQDAMNCGACGMACDPGATCFSGMSFFPGAPSVCCMGPDDPPFCLPDFGDGGFPMP